MIIPLITLIKGGKKIILLLKTNWSLFVYSLIFTQEFFVLSLVEIGQVLLRKKKKMWKVYRHMVDR